MTNWSVKIFYFFFNGAKRVKEEEVNGFCRVGPSILLFRPGARKKIPLVFSAFLLSMVFCVSCADSGPGGRAEVWADELKLTGLYPITILPGTTLVAEGEGFVGSFLGTSRIHLTGQFTSSEGGGASDVEHAFLVDVASSHELKMDVDRSTFNKICSKGDGDFVGQAVLEVSSNATGNIHRTDPRAVGFRCRNNLTPTLLGIEDWETYLNGKLSVTADDLLLGGDEGRTMVSISGCFLPNGWVEPCSSNGVLLNDERVPLSVVEEDLRRDGEFVFSPDLTGLQPGTLEASVSLVNLHSDFGERMSDPLDLILTIKPSELTYVDSEGSSLGGYIDFHGFGFVGGGSDELTEVLLLGDFVPDSGEPSLPIDLIIVPTFKRGNLVRYVLSDDDALGHIIDLRSESGTVMGTFTPTFSKGQDSVQGPPIQASFRVELIKQVVHVNFMQGFKDALDMMGLRNAEKLVQEQILSRARWLYGGINLEFRDEEPTDYELYSQVDITGQDPNGLGLMGYDNTPGKDVGNERLYDRIGGVNAETQQDGYPGYGGVFVDSFFAFSLHPPIDIAPHPAASGLFDSILDPLRPDTGDPVRSDELEGLPQVDGTQCPAPPGDRPMIIACAIYTVGNLLGTTMAHEVGHSLGLADPEGERFHNAGEETNRLMDSGGSRPFEERTVLGGHGPEVFCRENFSYLQMILPTQDLTDPVSNRPSCF